MGILKRSRQVETVKKEIKLILNDIFNFFWLKLFSAHFH